MSEKPGMTRLYERYQQVVKPALMQEFGYQNPMQVPRLEKIVVNMGVGEAVQDAKKMDSAVGDLTAITGQHPIVIRAKHSIATFKLRQNAHWHNLPPVNGRPVEVQDVVASWQRWRTTSGTRTILDHEASADAPVLSLASPDKDTSVRDFRGVSPRSFDGRGNYALGLKEQLVFPEIDYDKVDQVRGMDVVIVTTAKTDAEAKALLKAFDMPFTS